MSSSVPDRFRDLFYEQYPTVVRRLRQLVTDSAVAEDLAQEVFLRLYRNPPDDLDRIGPWLHRVLTRLAYDHFDMVARQVRLEQRVELWSHTNQEQTEPGSDEVIFEKMTRESVKRALATLSDRDRQALLLCHSGYSYGEIADIIGIQSDTVGTLLARATRRFRVAYMREEDDDREMDREDKAGSNS